MTLDKRYVFCVRCGRPVNLLDFVNRTWDELPPYCNQCIPKVKEAIIDNLTTWPQGWFGHAVKCVANGRAVWQVDVAHFEAQRFFTPVIVDLKDKKDNGIRD